MKKILSACSSVLALVALVGVQPACIWIWHQPDAPKALRK
jgi:cyclic lactone autoinducer peptide